MGGERDMGSHRAGVQYSSNIPLQRSSWSYASRCGHRSSCYARMFACAQSFLTSDPILSPRSTLPPLSTQKRPTVSQNDDILTNPEGAITTPLPVPGQIVVEELYSETSGYQCWDDLLRATAVSRVDPAVDRFAVERVKK